MIEKIKSNIYLDIILFDFYKHTYYNKYRKQGATKCGYHY